MRTDTIFYQLFLTFHSLLFELLGQPAENAEDYQFVSVEVKEKAFRFDGIFMPNSVDKPIYFVEVQFQKKPEFYWQFLSEILLYLSQYQPTQDWRAVAIFARRNYDIETLTCFQQELISSGRLVRVYLDELPHQDSIALGLVQLITTKDEDAPQVVKQLLGRVRSDISDAASQQSIIELLESVLVSKFSQLSRQEIEAMFLLSDIKQTRVYQEAREEGIEQGKKQGIEQGKKQGIEQGKKQVALNLLNAGMSIAQVSKVTGFTVEQLQQLQ